MLLANVYSCLVAFHGDASDPVNCTSVAIASIGKQSRRMPQAVRESFASGGMNFCLVPSVRGVSDASDTGTMSESQADNVLEISLDSAAIITMISMEETD